MNVTSHMLSSVRLTPTFSRSVKTSQLANCPRAPEGLNVSDRADPMRSRQQADAGNRPQPRHDWVDRRERHEHALQLLDAVLERANLVVDEREHGSQRIGQCDVRIFQHGRDTRDRAGRACGQQNPVFA
jgi:hypothetical protein